MNSRGMNISDESADANDATRKGIRLSWQSISILNTLKKSNPKSNLKPQQKPWTSQKITYPAPT